MTKSNEKCEGDDGIEFVDVDELALLAQNLNQYLRSYRNEQNIWRPNGGQYRRGSTNPRGN